MNHCWKWICLILVGVIILLLSALLIPPEALAKPEDKPDKPDKITIVVEGNEGTQSDLDTWLQARSANEWVMNTGIFLPRIMVWQQILIGRLQERLTETERELRELRERIEILEGNNGS